ncbi:MAG TPA: LPS assembly protein LptD [Rickettsiales bacterium]|nr:LPS assembly protein LptD [Rickettsiales bacterium]
MSVGQKYVVSACVLALAVFGSVSARALESYGVSNKQPVMLTAQAIGYDEHTGTAVAAGHVEVVQGDTIILADKVSYNQRTDTVYATGHVSVLEPGGDVLFAKELALKQSLEKGVVKEFRARLKDNSLFAAREAQKISKNVTKLKDAVYSPCQVCAVKPGEPPQSPLWQMSAQDVTIDENIKRVKYHNAFMDVYGVPVLYTPYFSHPTPDAPGQSGLLMPQYYHDSTIGNVVKQPVYLSLEPNMDMTLTPWYIGGENGPMLQAEFRHMTENAYYEIHGAIINAYNRDSAGNIVSGTEVRDYIDAHGTMKLSEHWNSGIDMERTSDNTFLALYGIGWQDMLTSRLYAERINDRDYALVESLAFQGLQPQDISNQSPYILPQAEMHVESAPFSNHSRLMLDSSALVLERQVGDSDQRVSSTASWKLPYVTRDGQVMDLGASVRGDAYNIVNQTVNPTTGETFSGTQARVIPEVDFDWRYPFINRLGDGKSLMIAPIVEAAASPNRHMPTTIPNEDSQISELSDINLFSNNRFTGLDQLESGMRGTYGTRGQLQFADDEYIQWLAGQAYEDNPQNPFPIASSTRAHYSDYVGRLALKYGGFDAAYSFRLDRETLSPISNEIVSSLSLAPVTVNATFISLHNEPLFGDRKSIFGDTSVDLTKHWTWSVSGRKDLGSNATTSTATTANSSAFNLLNPSQGTVGLGTGLIFHNECMTVNTSIGRSYITVQDVKPSTTFSVMVVLQSFGGGSTPSYTPGAGSIIPVNEPAPVSDINDKTLFNDTTPPQLN